MTTDNNKFSEAKILLKNGEEIIRGIYEYHPYWLLKKPVIE